MRSWDRGLAVVIPAATTGLPAAAMEASGKLAVGIELLLTAIGVAEDALPSVSVTGRRPNEQERVRDRGTQREGRGERSALVIESNSPSVARGEREGRVDLAVFHVKGLNAPAVSVPAAGGVGRCSVAAV